LPPDFESALIWALASFERNLALNPNDNEGVRFLREALLEGEAREEFREEEVAERR
jgi:hypothetical protein